MMAAEAPVPTVLAMLLCDQIITDATSKKKTLVGIFDRIVVSAMPAKIGNFYLYARITDAEGGYTLSIRIVRLADEKIMVYAETEEKAVKDRLAFADLAVAIPPFGIDQAGRYEVQLFANEVYIGRVTTEVVPLKEGNGA